jgi:hypothetical protein
MTGWIAIMLAAAGAAAAPAAQPLKLSVDDSGELVVIKVVGEAPSAWSGKYELEVTGGPPGGSSRSVQGGAAALRPNTPVTVATVRLGGRNGEVWTAHLHVTPAAGAAYDEEWRSQ